MRRPQDLRPGDNGHPFPLNRTSDGTRRRQAHVATNADSPAVSQRAHVLRLFLFVFVPGPLLAAGSGVLFGPVLGLVVTLTSTAVTATIAALVGRRAGRDSARSLIGEEWSRRIDVQIHRNGLWAVVGQRFIPGISDALASYAFGAFGVPLWQMAVGALIGSAPRAFVYTALGASISDLNSPLAYAAIGVWCVTAIIGVFAAHRGYRSWRTQRRDSRRPG
ncbi:MAG: TVP38/TMEM64 family protein [Mycobacteriaceae bacterium]|nr:TVP38/TMEM64 family protein [Mycobacteriaceae bacterium]